MVLTLIAGLVVSGILVFFFINQLIKVVSVAPRRSLPPFLCPAVPGASLVLYILHPLRSGHGDQVFSELFSIIFKSFIPL